jgi:hypothetical protein
MADTGDDAGQGSGPPEGRRRRQPPTVDVAAVEMPVADAASAEPSPEAAASTAAPASEPSAVPPAGRPRTPWFPILAAGTLGAGLAVFAGGAAWVYFAPLDELKTDDLTARLARVELQTQSAADVAAATVPDMGKVPAAKIEELAARLAKLEAAPAAPAPGSGRADTGKIEELSARISRLESAPPAAASDSARADAAAIKELSTRLAAVEAGMKPMAERVTALDRRSGDNATAVQAARERVESVAKAVADVSRTDADQDKLHQNAQAELAGLNGRLDAVEASLKAIRDQVAESAAPKTDESLRFALVAAGLRSALERGEPFKAELAAAKAVGVSPATLAELEPFAATGVPNPPDLFRELSGLIPEMLKASAPAGPEGNYLDRLQAHAEKLVRIRPVGDRPGDDAATVIGRIDRDMARRDLAAVLAEIDKLPAPAQAIAEPWRKKALARQAVAAASAQLVAASFARLGAPAGATNQ